MSTLETLREARINAMWARYCTLLESEGAESPIARRITTRLGTMRRAYMTGTLPRGWRFSSALEVADLGGQDFRPRPSRVRSEHRAGTPGRVADMAARMEAGEDLWCESDFTVEEVL